MMHWNRAGFGWLLAAAVVLVSLAPAEASVSGTSSAVWSPPEYPGGWKYCIEISWDETGMDGQGLSHFDLFLSFETCPCFCDPDYFAFADTVGSGPGTFNCSEACTVYYHASFICSGDPHAPIKVPTIKFEYYQNACEPDSVGSASVCFYSVAAPTSPGTYVDALGIKYGLGFETGNLVGVIPSCDWNYSGLEPSSWGQIKSLYR